MDTSLVRVLSVFHFWLKVRPNSGTLYLVSRLPEAFPVSTALDPPVENSYQSERHTHREREKEREEESVERIKR